MLDKKIIAELLGDKDKLANLLQLQLQDDPKHIKAFLAEDENSFFDVFVEMLDKAIRSLEEDAKNINGLGEDALSGLIANHLGNSFILSVTREEHSKGHVDLTVKRTTDGIKVLGESKIWDGYKYHVGGCSQVLSYSTGRNKHTFMIEFFTKDGGMYKKMKDLKERFEKEKPLDAVKISLRYSSVKGSFVSDHEHLSGSEVSITHTCCNLFTA